MNQSLDYSSSIVFGFNLHSYLQVLRLETNISESQLHCPNMGQSMLTTFGSLPVVKMRNPSAPLNATIS